jgi:pimeloyl-ACP methyl ester carboxylesterase
MVHRLGCDRFDALGISKGCRAPLQLAFQYPRRCRRLVLASSGAGMLMVPARLSVPSKMLTAPRYRDPAQPRPSRPSSGRMRRQPDELRRMVYEPDRPVTRTGYYLRLVAGFGWTSLPALPLIRQP